MGLFRTAPPTVSGRDLVLRSRLLSDLARRFETRLTTIVAGPGFGKTVLLAQALDQNDMVTIGQDRWVGCNEADQNPAVFGATILKALGAECSLRQPDSADLIADLIIEAVWAQAPFDVALIFDDFHLVGNDSGGAALVAELIQRLPANGHLVLSSREPLPFAVSKQRSEGNLIEFDQVALGFDDQEYQSFLEGRPGLVGVEQDGPRCPALATLVVDSGRDAAMDFLWEEVLAHRPSEVQRSLALVASFQYFDQGLLDAVSDDGLECEQLVVGLPLVLSGQDGQWELHSLWAPVLAKRVGQADRIATLKRGGEYLLDSGDLVPAAEAFAEAGDDDGLLRVATTMCFRPLTNAWVNESCELLRVLPNHLANTGLGRLLEAFAELEMRHQWNALAAFEVAAAELRASNMPELEAQALVVASQLSGVRFGLPPAPQLYPRAVELATEGNALAASMVARFEAYAALTGGDPDLALSYIDDFGGFGPVRGTMLADQLRCDCGRPELVGEVTTSADDLELLAADNQVNIQLAYALWVRGEIPPEVAVPLAKDLIERTAVQRISHQRIHVIAVAVVAALAADDLELAEHLTAQGRQLLDPELGHFVAGFVHMSEMVLTLARGDEDKAAEILRKQLDVVSLATWPPRPYHHVLSPLYVLLPEARELLDSIELGPGLSEVISASRALVHYRETSDPSGLESIDWRRLGTLRANIALPHLLEMALGANVDLDSDFVEPSQRLEAPRRILNGLAKSNRPVASAAKAALGKMTGGPSFALRLDVLGPLKLIRDGEVVTDDNWVRRERVRMLCGFLVHHRSTARRDVAGALWPDLGEEKALSNLRVNLRLLLGVFEPDRPAGGSSWFIDSEGPNLTLRRDRIQIDALEFDTLIDDARRSDDRGVPGQALNLYQEAAALYEGDYLEDRNYDQWVEFERIRLRSSSALANTRVAELLLARGEPEDAIHFASCALVIEPLLERAHLCRVRAFVGQQNRGAAREAGKLLLNSIEEAGLVPEPDSVALLNSLGLGSSASEAMPDRNRR